MKNSEHHFHFCRPTSVPDLSRSTLAAIPDVTRRGLRSRPALMARPFLTREIAVAAGPLLPRSGSHLASGTRTISASLGERDTLGRREKISVTGRRDK